MSNPETEPFPESEFTNGLAKIIEPEDLNVFKEECPTNPKNPLEKSAENLDSE